MVDTTVWPVDYRTGDPATAGTHADEQVLANQIAILDDPEHKHLVAEVHYDGCFLQANYVGTNTQRPALLNG
jgi:hypothetical protein